MFRRDEGQFNLVFDHLFNVNIMMIAYMVPPYGIKWKGRRRKMVKNIFKGFPS